MKLIDKDALVAEIEKIIADETESIKTFEHSKNVSERQRSNARIETLMYIRSLLDTLEVKEVDEPRYNGFMGKELQMVDDEIHRLENLKVKEVDLEKEWKEFLKDGDVGFKEIAQHFFELGMSVSNKAQKK